MGDSARLSGVNIVGMQRRGFSREEIQAMRNAFQLLFADGGTLSERVEDLAARFSDVKPVKDIIDFIRADSSRAICQPGERSKGNGG
jgi:UDP-N-acetylglucosamine acyltransferase